MDCLNGNNPAAKWLCRQHTQNTGGCENYLVLSQVWPGRLRQVGRLADIFNRNHESILPNCLCRFMELFFRSCHPHNDCYQLNNNRDLNRHFFDRKTILWRTLVQHRVLPAFHTFRPNHPQQIFPAQRISELLKERREALSNQLMKMPRRLGEGEEQHGSRDRRSPKAMTILHACRHRLRLLRCAPRISRRQKY
jgi:hypothetical protein